MNEVGIYFINMAILLIVSPFFLFSQTPDTMWTKVYGGLGSERGSSIDLTNDGGYIVSGYTNSFGTGGADFWLLKTDKYGDTLWTKTFGGEHRDVSYSVHQTIGGGFILSGFTESFGEALINFWLIKTDENGDTIWTKTYTDNNVQKCNYSEQTSDSGYILVGYTGPSIQFNTDIWLIKTNRNGNIEWNKKYGGTDGENAFWVEQTSDGGYIFVGATRSFGNSNDTDIWLIKTSELGDTIWTRTFGELGEDVGFSVRQTKDGGYIICGVTESVGAGEGDGWILKTNANGDTTWTKVFGGYSADYLNCIQQTIDGGYIATGFTYSYGQGMSDVWIVKLDSNGRLVWEKTLGGMDDDGASYANKTKDGGYVIVGATNSLGPNDLWLIRMEPDSTVTVGNNNDWLSEFFLVQNYPNPFNPSTKINYQIPEISFITIKVYDVLGNLIDTLVNEEKPIGIYEIDFNAENLPSGVYFYQLKAGEFVSTKKMLLLK